MDEAEFERQLTEWIDDFHAEALRAFHTGCHIPDVLNIAQVVANSRQNRRSFERQQSRVIPAMGGLPRVANN